jgi:F-type H+-transporting ATPase subunit b
MHFDATFFALVALVLFFVIVFYAKAPAKITAMLDDRSGRIAKDISDARKLREEAEALLNEYKQKRADAVKEAAGIVEQAKREAEAYASEARIKLDEMLARRTRQAEQKIAQAEAAATKDVRAAATDAAITAAARLIAEGSTGAKSAKFVEESIAAVKSRLN